MRRVGVILAGLVVAAACSSGTVDDVAADPTPTVEVTEPTATPDPTPTPEPTATPEPTSNEDVQVAWENFVEGAFGPAGDADHLALALEYGTQTAVDRLAIFQGSFDRQVNQHYTKIEPTDTGFVINDCFSTTPPIGRPAWLWFSAVVIDTDDGPLIESVQGEQIEVDCVPAQLAQGALDGYDAYREAFLTFFNPPDPDSELIEGTMTGLQLEGVAPFVQQALDDGWVVRGGSDRHPEVTEIPSADVIFIQDCYTPSDDYGAYVVETGERLDEIIEPVTPGERDLSVVEMRREEGTWKVFGINGLLRTDCEFAPTSAALPVV